MVGFLRLAVPAVGALLLAVLLIQITISSFGARFGLGKIEISQDQVRVETPEYTGTLSDGSVYRVWAEEAAASITNTDLITLTNARVVMERPDGFQRSATSELAVLDAVTQQVRSARLTEISESTGTTGRLNDTVFDWASQTLIAKGPVEINYTDGADVHAEGLLHDAESGSWTFFKAVVTLPATPGENIE